MIHSHISIHEHYQQLKLGERATIQALHATVKTITETVLMLCRSKSTISRETTRGALSQLDSNPHSHQVYLAETG